jgi:hypothetical protein
MILAEENQSVERKTLSFLDHDKCVKSLSNGNYVELVPYPFQHGPLLDVATFML